MGDDFNDGPSSGGPSDLSVDALHQGAEVEHDTSPDVRSDGSEEL